MARWHVPVGITFAFSRGILLRMIGTNARNDSHVGPPDPGLKVKTLPIVEITVGAVLIFALTLDLTARFKRSAAAQAPPQTVAWSTTIVLEAPKLGDGVSAGSAYPAWRQATGDFASAFAYDRYCNGLTLMLSDREGFQMPKGRLWSLHIEPTTAAQVWSVRHVHESGDSAPGLIGHDSSAESAASHVCAIVRQEGGIVR